MLWAFLWACKLNFPMAAHLVDVPSPNEPSGKWEMDLLNDYFGLCQWCKQNGRWKEKQAEFNNCNALL
jgi:hypothetical protein